MRRVEAPARTPARGQRRAVAGLGARPLRTGVRDTLLVRGAAVHAARYRRAGLGSCVLRHSSGEPRASRAWAMLRRASCMRVAEVVRRRGQSSRASWRSGGQSLGPGERNGLRRSVCFFGSVSMPATQPTSPVPSPPDASERNHLKRACLARPTRVDRFCKRAWTHHRHNRRQRGPH